MKKTKQQEIAETEQYIQFLEKALSSTRFRANVTEEKLVETKEKLKKARFRLKIMQK